MRSKLPLLEKDACFKAKAAILMTLISINMH